MTTITRTLLLLYILQSALDFRSGRPTVFRIQVSLRYSYERYFLPVDDLADRHRRAVLFSEGARFDLAPAAPPDHQRIG